MSDDTSKVIVLCSGVGLGFYVPGLVVARRLAAMGIATEVHVFESCLLDAKREGVQEARKAFQRDFKLALTAQKLARDVSPAIDWSDVDEMLLRWQESRPDRFILFSGFWLPIIRKYMERLPLPDQSVDLCHVDSAMSTSWRLYDAQEPCFNHVWLASWERKEVGWRLPISDDAPIAFGDRPDRVLIHGGGWGIGDFSERASDLRSAGIAIDILVTSLEDTAGARHEDRGFMIDPAWSPWETNASGEHVFPPFAEVHPKQTEFSSNYEYPDVYDIVRSSKTIVSKPGAGTLVDSIASATPIVFLQPYGDYEAKNQLLWEHLGFGISFDAWRGTRFSLDVLAELHAAILESRSEIASYVEGFACNPRRM